MKTSPRLFQAVRDSRMAVSREYSGLLAELDFPQRIRSSVKQHPFRWLGGAVVTGFITTIFGGSRSFRKAEKSTLSTAESPTPASKAANTLSKVGWGAAVLEIAKLLFPVLRPILLEFVTNTARTGLARKNRPK